MIHELVDPKYQNYLRLSVGKMYARVSCVLSCHGTGEISNMVVCYRDTRTKLKN